MATLKKSSAPVTTKKTGTAKKIQAVKPAAPKPVVKKPLFKKAVTQAPLKKTTATGKPSPKPAAKPAVKAEKVKKPKLVRDSFTIPKAEYLVLDELKLRAAKLTRPAKKSELLRAGIKALAALSDAAFLAALEQVPAIKTGRPASE
jgi:hypothetical protein